MMSTVSSVEMGIVEETFYPKTQNYEKAMFQKTQLLEYA